MKIRASIVCLCLLGTGTQLAWADASTKAAKITELMQLTGTRQFLHEIDGKVDQEEAARAWGRFYSENVSEGDLDSILAYYRSPAGQKDVSASRAALGDMRKFMAQKRAATAASVGTAPGGTGTAAGVGLAASGTGTAAGAGTAPGGTGTAAGVGLAVSGTGTAARVGTAPGAVGPTSAVPPSVSAVAPNGGQTTAGGAGLTPQPWGSAPRAPDGRVVPSPSLPEQCNVSPTPAPGLHAVPSSGKSVVCVCTDEKGALTRDPVIAESSGDARVDSGAIKMARVDSGRYIPPTVEGRPQSACFRFAIDFSHRQ